MDNVKEWTSLPLPELLITTSHREDCRRISVESSLMSPMMTKSLKGLNWTLPHTHSPRSHRNFCPCLCLSVTNFFFPCLHCPLSSSSSSIPQLWHTTDYFPNQFPPFFSVLHCPLGLDELQACPLPDVVFPPLPLSALSSSPSHCAMQDGFGQTWWTGDVSMPLQFASLNDGQEVFVWSNCLLYLCTDFLIGNTVLAWDA